MWSGLHPRDVPELDDNPFDPMTPELKEALDGLVEEWDKIDDETDIGPIPFGMAVRDVIKVWTGRTEPNDPESAR